MKKFFALYRGSAYPLVRLALLAVGLLGVAIAGGAPVCFPDSNGCP